MIETLRSVEELIGEKGHKGQTASDKPSVDAPALDAASVPLEPVYDLTAPQQKLLHWSGYVGQVGDCTIQNMRVFFWSDGRARFEAHVRSSDTGDVWLMRNGLSIHDNNGVEMWRSGKLVGPEMPWIGQTRDWKADFFYPALWFVHINSARANGLHC